MRLFCQQHNSLSHHWLVSHSTSCMLDPPILFYKIYHFYFPGEFMHWTSSVKSQRNYGVLPSSMICTIFLLTYTCFIFLSPNYSQFAYKLQQFGTKLLNRHTLPIHWQPHKNEMAVSLLYFSYAQSSYFVFNMFGVFRTFGVNALSGEIPKELGLLTELQSLQVLIIIMSLLS